MVKADGYGCGAVPVARSLEALDPWGFGVATIAEGEELRRAGIERPILVATPLLPWDFADARRLHLTPTLGAPEAISAWADSGGGDWHLAIETGMNRSGVRWDAVSSVYEMVRRHPPAGAFTHLHSAEVNDETLREQQNRFRETVAELPERPRYLHVEASAAIERQSPSPWDLVRPGVFLYGAGGDPGSAVIPEPVAHLRARAVEVRHVPNGETVSYGATWRAARDSRIATVAIGYADGFRRAFSNGGNVLVRGHRAKVVGLVNMDMVMIDVTDVACEVGDAVTLLGRDGDAHLDLNHVSREAKLSPYEMLVGLRMRVPRVYRS
jgi:alanine racemase